MILVTTGVYASAAATVAVALANRGRQHARSARVQVENDHPTNLREEQDERAEATAKGLNAILSSVGHLRGDIGGIRSELRSDREAVRHHNEATDSRLLELENTLNRRKRNSDTE